MEGDMLRMTDIERIVQDLLEPMQEEIDMLRRELAAVKRQASGADRPGSYIGDGQG